MTTDRRGSSRTWSTAALLLAAAGLCLVYVFAPADPRFRAELSDAALMGTTLLAGVVILFWYRGRRTWKTAPYFGLGLLGLAVVEGAFLVVDVMGTASYRPTSLDLLYLLLGAIFLVPISIEYKEHFPREEWQENATDVALIAAALGCIAYLFLRPEQADTATTISSAVFALIAVAAFTPYGALALWVPSPAHLGQFAVIGTFAAAELSFGAQWVRGIYVPAQAQIELPFGVGALALAYLLIAIPAPAAEAAQPEPTRYGRPMLTATAVAAACAALGIVGTMEVGGRVEPVQASALIALLAIAVAVRILVNQVRSTEASHRVKSALAQKEAALGDTDQALARLREVNQTLRVSEERLRLVFEAAVDGIVELDDKDVILRVNNAFCRMVDLPQEVVEGQPWTALANSIEAEESFASLPVTGQGTIKRDGNALYVEARTSEIPEDPPRRLLLVRDVTAARVADQTIRSLFKFLQDRDEDRTRIMRRTNAAIESERNRIARDLHDGPVQGVSAASLSLEAVLLMLKAGELDEGTEVLGKIRLELSEEADNLRRLMSGLRPPLLEERGLVPAIRENLAKFGRDNDIETEFVSRSLVEVPTDLETLAYRIVQEALSNAGKHSKAERIAVTVEAVAGQLRIEVSDDGVGFDAAQARQFLQQGRVGLASMRERVELANGTFMVHSTLGKGTTVLATLPLDSVPAPRELAVNEA